MRGNDDGELAVALANAGASALKQGLKALSMCIIAPFLPLRPFAQVIFRD